MGIAAAVAVVPRHGSGVGWFPSACYQSACSLGRWVVRWRDGPWRSRVQFIANRAGCRCRGGPTAAQPSTTIARRAEFGRCESLGAEFPGPERLSGLAISPTRNFETKKAQEFRGCENARPRARLLELISKGRCWANTCNGNRLEA